MPVYHAVEIPHIKYWCLQISKDFSLKEIALQFVWNKIILNT